MKDARSARAGAGVGGGAGGDPAGGHARGDFGVRVVCGFDLAVHSGRVGMARRMAAAGAPTHEIMAQGRWKTARMVEVYTRSEEAGRAAKWLWKMTFSSLSVDL